MSSFRGSRKIILQPNDRNVPFGFKITQFSGLTTNDGFIPYTVNVSSVEVAAFTEDGTDVTDYLVETSSLVDNNVIVRLNYPTIFGAGKYWLRFILTLDNNAIIEADFGRVFCEQLGY